MFVTVSNVRFIKIRLKHFLDISMWCWSRSAHCFHQATTDPPPKCPLGFSKSTRRPAEGWPTRNQLTFPETTAAAMFRPVHCIKTDGNTDQIEEPFGGGRVCAYGEQLQQADNGSRSRVFIRVYFMQKFQSNTFQCKTFGPLWYVVSFAISFLIFKSVSKYRCSLLQHKKTEAGSLMRVSV